MATRKLLLADDSVTIQKVVNLTFADEGMEVTSVGDGDSAVEKLEELMPDIVLADVHMPGLTGYQVCEHIKTGSRYKHIPVILLVGSFEPFDEDEARRVGADDYLTKPFQSIRQLVSRVGSLLSQAKEESFEGGVTQPLSSAYLPAESQEPVEQPYFESPTPMIEPEELETPEPVAEVTAESWTSPQQSFADSAIDDELLEATPVSSSEPSEQPTTFSSDIRATTRLSTEDLKGFGFESSPSITSSVEEPQEIDLSATVPIIRREEIDAAMTETTAGEVVIQPATIEVSSEPGPAHVVIHPSTVSVAATSSPYSTSPLSDDSILDLGYAEAPPAPAFDEEFVLDLEEEYQETETLAAPTPSVFAEPATSFVPTAAPEEPTTLEPPPVTQAEELVAPAEMPPVQFEETRPQEIELELPPPPIVERETAPAPVVTESVARPSVTETAPPITGPISPSSLSQDTIDAIARRVVEMMSERVVQEIAWEVVPELADLHIKRKMQEKGL